MVMVLSYTDAVAILSEIETTTDDSLREEMFTLAIRYARLRVDWLQAGGTGDAEREATRTRAHNVFIDSLNIISRHAAKSGQSVEWCDKLGKDRKVIGDFACYLHAILGLRAR